MKFVCSFYWFYHKSKYNKEQKEGINRSIIFNNVNDGMIYGSNKSESTNDNRKLVLKLLTFCI